MKICTKCKENQPDNQFWLNKRDGGLLPHCKTCKAKYVRLYRKSRPNMEKERYQRDKIGTRERHLKRKYGVTLAAYDAMFKAQNGCCAICGKTQPKAFDVDHCHATGKVRGLLCSTCNRMIGYAKDDPRILQAALRYIVPQVAAEFIKAHMECRP